MSDFKEWMLAVSVFMLLITLYIELIWITFRRKIKGLEKELIEVRELLKGEENE